MKRCLLILVCLALLCGLTVPSAQAEGETVYSYDFDFHFHLEPAAFDDETRERIQGYADLLEMLEVKGSWTYCHELRSMDSTFSVIPETNPDAALSFHLYGYPSHIVVESSLLGSHTIFFNNDALLEFCLKAYEHLGLPLTTIGLMYPYSFEHAFANVSEAWRNMIGSYGKSRTLSVKSLKSFALAWADLLDNDRNLSDWISAVSMLNDQQEVLSSEMQQIPDYLTHTLAKDGKIRIESENNEERWFVGRSLILEESRQQNEYNIETSFPPTASGYQPVFHLVKNEKEENNEVSLLIAYDPADKAEQPLIHLDAQLLWPSVWPAASVYNSHITLDSSLLGSLDLTLMLDCQASGSFVLTCSKPVQGNPAEAFRLEGVLIPRHNVPVPQFSIAEIITNVNIFSVNDVTLNEFVHAIARPAITGALAFLIEVPASAVQSVMDDLTDFGVLGVVLGD